MKRKTGNVSAAGWKLWAQGSALALAMMLAGTGRAAAQSCFMGSDMEPAVQSALTTTAQRYFDMTARGDSASLKLAAIPSLASNFSGIEGAVKDNQANLAGAKGTVRPPFLLKAEGAAPLERAEFLCGVFGTTGQTRNSAVFVIPNLPPGNYAVTIVDADGSKGAYTVSMVLQQMGTDWKLGGFYVKPSMIKGHDGNWYVTQARDYKSKGQTHNAWFYFLEARDLLSPVPFMSTLQTDKLYDESQAAKPTDMPGDLAAGAKTYKITSAFPLVVGSDLDLVVKYDSADVSNTGQTFQENVAVMKALLTKFPEFRSAFDGVVARAVEPSGRDYGTMMPMKDIK